jgi:hypothetical protein
MWPDTTDYAPKERFLARGFTNRRAIIATLLAWTPGKKE